MMSDVDFLMILLFFGGFGYITPYQFRLSGFFVLSWEIETLPLVLSHPSNHGRNENSDITPLNYLQLAARNYSVEAAAPPLPACQIACQTGGYAFTEHNSHINYPDSPTIIMLTRL